MAICLQLFRSTRKLQETEPGEEPGEEDEFSREEPCIGDRLSPVRINAGGTFDISKYLLGAGLEKKGLLFVQLLSDRLLQKFSCFFSCLNNGQ